MKKLKTPNIPSKFRITSKVDYEVLFVNEFPKDNTQVGEMRPQEKQIVIKNGQSNSELISTTIHEIFHCFSEEYNIGLTEKQVEKLEQATYRFLRLNGVL